MANDPKQPRMQKCADCGELVPINTRKGARDGRWLCTPCFDKVYHGILPAPRGSEAENR
jgi:formylmethanofuran dehydrogenase subunit E